MTVTLGTLSRDRMSCVSREASTRSMCILTIKGTLLLHKGLGDLGRVSCRREAEGIQVNLVDICVPGMLSGNSYMSHFILLRPH